MNTTSPIRSDPRTDGRTRPGWIEIIIGSATFALVAYGMPRLFPMFDLDPVGEGLAFGALSGLAGLAGFFAAVAVRRRSLAAFGVRRTTGRWLAIGIAGGIAALVVSNALVVAWILVFGPAENVQAVYTEAALGGTVPLILSTLFLAVLTPVGEEFLFRGVLTTALLRYGPPVGVIGSAVVFSLAHGLTIVVITALVVGVIAGELRRRSDSIWPGVIVHVVNNITANLLGAFLASLG